jgi:hypothetical protein
MAKFINPNIRVRTSIGVSPRPLPRSLIDTYYQSEADFRKLIERLELDPTFKKLVDRGVLQKVQFRGRIPQYRYEECKDEEMVRFFKKYNVTRHPDWEHDFLTPTAIGRKHLIAKKYGAPVGELLSVLRYTAFLSTMRDTLPETRVTSTDEEDHDFLKFAPSDTIFDTEPVAAEIAQFVQRHNVPQEMFVECFMSQEVDDEAILEKIACSREEIAKVRKLVERIQVLNSFCVDSQPARQVQPGKVKEKFGPIAEFSKVGDGLDVKVNLVDDGVYSARYRFLMEQGASKDVSRQEHEFLNQLRAVNQRKNVLHRLILFLFRYQYKYLLTGNPLDMYPLSQAAAAKAIFEEEATVSRIIRDKVIVTPWGVVPIKFFFHRVSKTVENLVLIREQEELKKGTRTRPFTDVEIRDILKAVYHVDLSRRSITYHRNRCLKKSNFYSRVRNARPVEG